MCDGAHDENDKIQQARELRLMRQTLDQLRSNTTWTALGAVSGWAAIAVALYVVLFT